MTHRCPHEGCQALKWKGEPKGMCCHGGKVTLPLPAAPPAPLDDLLRLNSPSCNQFRNHLVKYNNKFALTSTGMTHAEPNDGNPWKPNIRISGKVYHYIGSFVPESGREPLFLQVYFLDDEAAATQRQAPVGNETLDPDILAKLQAMLHEENSYVRSFKAVAARVRENPDDFRECTIVIDPNARPQGVHPGRLNLPENTEIGLLIGPESGCSRNIRIELHGGGLSTVSETHRSYDPMSYPLLLPRGTDGWTPTMRCGTTKITPSMYYAFKMMVREDVFNGILWGCRLFQQYVVDMGCKVETERLNYIMQNQDKLKRDKYTNFVDAVDAGDTRNAGIRTILPATFVGGPRYMHQKMQDGMAIVQKLGIPGYFHTMTCNPRSPAIQRELFNYLDEDGEPTERKQTASDRPDIVGRVFYLLIKDLIDSVKGGILGRYVGHLGTLEMQKRGLPHIHLLIWVHPEDSPRRGDNIDQRVRAEIPDPQAEPELHAKVRAHMIHGPCGSFNPNSPCMKNGKCSKGYPEDFQQETVTTNKAFPRYRRRSPQQGGFTTDIFMRSSQSVVTVDNRWVVPYNPDLLLRYDAHSCTEVSATMEVIKYVVAYIQKGHDAAVFGVFDRQNEVRSYQLGRFLGPVEAFWRMVQFPIHFRFPAVLVLTVHLEDEQNVHFTEETAVATAERGPPATTLTEFFRLCRSDDFAMTLLYREVPEYYTEGPQHRWIRRKRGTRHPEWPGVFQAPTISRVAAVSPRDAELFFLRVLLQFQRGPTSFEALRTIDGEVCETYREACQRLGLTENDAHWTMALTEATVSKKPRSLRYLFAIILVYGLPSDPPSLWEEHREALGEDVTHRRRATIDEVEGEVLGLLQNQLTKMGGGVLTDYGLPAAAEGGVQEEQEEAAVEGLDEDVDRLTVEQREVYNRVCEAVSNEGPSGIFFVDAPGGTGKTFLLNTVIRATRREGREVLAVASSGIAATLLDSGGTAHNTFAIPLNIEQDDVTSLCNINLSSEKAAKIRRASLIVWDEAPMTSRYAVETVDRTLRLLLEKDAPMGGIATLLAGDFRQLLPVVPRGTRADQLNACIKASPLWRHVTSFKLTRNLRIRNDSNPEAHQEYLLSVGEGRVEETEDGRIPIPADLQFSGVYLRVCLIFFQMEQIRKIGYPTFIKSTIE